MFWDKNDTPSHNIEALLEKENAKVEEFLEEDDIIQECKTQKKSIVNYFTRPDVIRRMIELITTEPPEDLPMAQRFRHANVACEILMLGIPSLDEKLIADEELLNLLYSYLENEPPLNPLLASFFSKTFSLLFTKKSDQDWFLYQQLCLKLLEFLKKKNNFLDLICKHFTTPVIPDIIMEMMNNIDGGQLRKSLYDWLNEERLVEKFLDIIGDPEQSEKHANVAEFLCDLIHHGRTMRQSDQDNDGFEPIFEGSNPVLKNIESATTLLALFNVILQPNALESAIVSGITVVLKIIKPGMIIDEPNLTRYMFLQDREKEIHDELLSTVIRVIEPQLKHFNELIRNPPKKSDIVISTATLSPPFGMTRLQICRLFTVLFQTKNEEISKAICETDFFDILLSLLKEYSWNNFLHSEVEKCFQTIFYTKLSNNNNSTHVSVGSHYKPNNYGDNVFVNSSSVIPDVGTKLDAVAAEATQPEATNDGCETTTAEQLENPSKADSTDGCEGDTTKTPAGIEPTAIQIHLIANCKVVSKLLECWQINTDAESGEKGRRLGYMGHLIKIFQHITNCISESEHIGALIESNLRDDAERELWQTIVNPTDGELSKSLAVQSKLLANCEACDYDISMDFVIQDDISDVFNNMCGFTDSEIGDDVIFTLEYNTQQESDDDGNDEDNDDDGDNDNGGDDDDDDHDDHDDHDDEDGDENDKNEVDDEIKSSNSGVNENDDVKVREIDDHQSSIHLKNDLDLFQFGRSNDYKEEEDDTVVWPEKVLQEFHDMYTTRTATFSWAAEFRDLFEPTTSSAKTSEEYDNNANVERYVSSSDSAELAFQLKKDNNTTKNYVKNDFVDYYEDDEGMWTKPLGGASESNKDDQAQEDAFAAASGNGPIKSQLGLENVANTFVESTTKNQLNKPPHDVNDGGYDDDDALEEEFDTISSRTTKALPISSEFTNPKDEDETSPIIVNSKHNSITIDDTISDNSVAKKENDISLSATESETASTTTTTINATTTEDSVALTAT